MKELENSSESQKMLYGVKDKNIKLTTTYS